jgi:hypothetical protein
MIWIMTHNRDEFFTSFYIQSPHKRPQKNLLLHRLEPRGLSMDYDGESILFAECGFAKVTRKIPRCGDGSIHMAVM